MQTLYETRVSSSSFSTPEGLTEIFITATSRDDATFDEALEELREAYLSALNDYELTEYSLQFTRIYVSDAANENQHLLKSGLFALLQSGAISVIEQRPLCGPVALHSYHLKNERNFQHKIRSVKSGSLHSCQSKYTSGIFYTLLWTAHNTGDGKDSYTQTETLFSDLVSLYKKYNLNMQNNTVRTWIYVRDIDNNYKGMVEARREYFNKINLVEETRYIASTGIEGKTEEAHSLVTLDSLSIGNLQEEQIMKMEAPEHLSSTAIYGVTFERGLKIQFGDRSHLYISGTASINDKGDILYPGDIVGQTERTIENIEALLMPHGAKLEDMLYIIIYIRNRKQYQFIQDILASKIPASVPLLSVEGAVCRPGWLIEMEGVAIIEDSTVYPPFL